MKTILITGGTGGLGSALADEARAAGHRIRIMSRRPAPVSLLPNTEWAQADVLTGQGLRSALDGVDTVIHAATSPFNKAWETEVEGTRNMAAAAKAAHTPHFIYVSIVGIDRIPLTGANRVVRMKAVAPPFEKQPQGHEEREDKDSLVASFASLRFNPDYEITTDPARVPYFYYRAKLAAEQVVMASGIDYTIQRATQFHSLLDLFLGMLLRFPLALLPTDFRSQPIATRDAARVVVRLADGAPQGQVADSGGPEVLTWGEMARMWVQARGIHRAWLPMHVPGRLAAVFRSGYTTCPEARVGTQTWGAWLRERYARRSDDARRPVRET